MSHLQHPPTMTPFRSARWLWAALPVLLVWAACGGGGGGGGDTPSAPGASCANVAGQWTVSIANSCGTGQDTTVNVAQNGCQVQFTAPLVGQVSGTLGSTANPGLLNEADLSVDPPASCGGGASAGVLRVVSGTEMNMQWGTGQGCCRHGSAGFER